MDMEKFQDYIQIFDQICETSTELNSLFSWPVLLLLVSKFISVLSTAFAYIFQVVIQSSLLHNPAILVILFASITDWVRILIILHAADMPIHQVDIGSTQYIL